MVTSLAEIWGSEPIESVRDQQQRLAVRVHDLDQRVDHLLSRRSLTREATGQLTCASFDGVVQKCLDLLSKAHRHIVAALKALTRITG